MAYCVETCKLRAETSGSLLALSSPLVKADLSNFSLFRLRSNLGPSLKENTENNACFASSLPSFGQCQDFAPSLQCRHCFCPFYSFKSIQEVASLRIDPTLYSQIPSSSSSLLISDHPSSHSESRHLAQQSGLGGSWREDRPPPTKKKLHPLSPSIFSEGAEFDSEFIPTGEGDLFFKYTDKCGHDGAH